MPGGIKKCVRTVVEAILSRPGDLRKFFRVTVGRGQTVWPKSPKDQLRYGLRLDYDGVVTRNGKEYNKFQVQPNAGKIPSPIKEWRESHGGTHAVFGTVFIEKDVDPNGAIFAGAIDELFQGD
ncbi:MAG: hypothetical protein M1817_003327 [Caeruleum heppii]|nr:MAG: hypothetical protein M1817_003327 [Caeruleum heppii]